MGDRRTSDIFAMRAEVTAASTRHSIMSTEAADLDLNWDRTSKVVSMRQSRLSKPPEPLATKAGLKDLNAACFCIIIMEFAERFAFYSLQQLFGPYTTLMLNYDDAGYAGVLNFWTFWNYGCPILGAYVSDAYLGRFNTIAYIAPIYLAGMLLMGLSSSPLGFADFPWDPADGGWATMGFWLAMVVIGIGSGMIKPSVSIFAADQLKDKDGNECSPEVLGVLYLYWYMAINLGSFIGQFSMPFLIGTPPGLPNILNYPDK